jgi:hypothetical protein
MSAGFDAVRCVRAKTFLCSLPRGDYDLLRGFPREAEPFTRDFRANEKFHLSPACRVRVMDFLRRLPREAESFLRGLPRGAALRGD